MPDTTAPIEIRDADLSDRAAANAIHKSAYPNDPYTYANNIGLRGTINLVAVKNNLTVGFISVLINQPNPHGRFLWERMQPYIGYVGVSEEARRSGIAKKLVIEASRRALHFTGKSHIYLECENNNENAQKLYEKIGFEAISPEEIEKAFGRPPHANSRVYRAEYQLFDS